MQKKTIDLNLLRILCQCNLNAFEVIWTFGNLQGSFSYGRHFVQQSKSVCAVSVEGIQGSEQSAILNQEICRLTPKWRKAIF